MKLIVDDDFTGVIEIWVLQYVQLMLDGAMPEGDKRAAEPWNDPFTQMGSEIPRTLFKTWLRDAKAISFEGEILMIQVASESARGFLEEILFSTIRRVVAGIKKRDSNVKLITKQRCSQKSLLWQRHKFVTPPVS